MNISNDGTMQLINQALNAATQRHTEISHNIANVNTRNYKASRVVFESELKKALDKTNGRLNTTHSKHIDIASNISDIQPKVVKDNSTSMRLDGNNVDIDMENANLAANQLLYNALIIQANSKISTLRHVISEGNR